MKPTRWSDCISRDVEELSQWEGRADSSEAMRYHPGERRWMFESNNCPLPPLLVIRDYKGRISETGQFENVPRISP